MERLLDRLQNPILYIRKLIKQKKKMDYFMKEFLGL